MTGGTEIPFRVRYWRCPKCRLVDRTEKGETNRFHDCPAMAGLNIPLAEVQHPDDMPDARQVVVQREDSRAVASVRTERGDGSNDCTVFVGPATLHGAGKDPS